MLGDQSTFQRCKQGIGMSRCASCIVMLQYSVLQAWQGPHINISLVVSTSCVVVRVVLCTL